MRNNIDIRPARNGYTITIGSFTWVVESVDLADVGKQLAAIQAELAMGDNPLTEDKKKPDFYWPPSALFPISNGGTDSTPVSSVRTNSDGTTTDVVFWK